MGLFLGRTETRLAGGWLPEPPIPAFFGAGIPGAPVVATSDTALQVPTVWACVSLIAGAVSSMPLETFRRSSDPNAVPRRLADPPLVTSPDVGMTQSEWLFMLVVSLLLRGNAYGLITRDAALRPVGIHLLNPDAVAVAVQPDTGRIVYRWAHGTRANQIIPSDDVWHVRGMTMPGSVVGLSPIAYAAATLGLDLSSRQFAHQFFDGGGIPKAVLESEQQINQTQADTIKDRVMAKFKAREPIVLGLGLKYTQVQVKPEESQFLATQHANVAQVCRYFSVPAAMVDGPAGGGMQYTNTEQRGIEFLVYTLARWLKRIEDAMYVLLPGTQYVRFNTHSLLRLDAETQAKVDLQRLAGRIITPSEVRARDGLDPMTEAQKLEVDMVPVGVGPLGRPVALPGINDPHGPTAPVPGAENPTGA